MGTKIQAATAVKALFALVQNVLYVFLKAGYLLRTTAKQKTEHL